MLTFLIPAKYRCQAIIVAAALFVAGLLWMRSMGLQTAVAPDGILAIEFAGTQPRAEEIIKSWEVKFSDSLNPVFDDLMIDDVLFIPVYTTGLGLLCLWARGVLSKTGNENEDTRGCFYRAGTLLALGQIMTAVLDYTENQAIRAMLHGPVADPWPQITSGLASVKSGLIILGLIYTILGLGAWLIPRIVTIASQALANAKTGQ
jgi:hypothetical protein